MKPLHFAVAAAVALAACQPAQAPAPEAEAVQSLMDQVQAMAPEQQPVFAYQQLVAHQQANPAVQPLCTSPRATESRPIPDNVAPDSFYAQFKGAAVYSVQCGQLVSQSRMDPREHWLVVFAPGAAEAQIVSCADAQGKDQCPLPVPVAAEATPTSATP
jgi:hypothetical protein